MSDLGTWYTLLLESISKSVYLVEILSLYCIKKITCLSSWIPPSLWLAAARPEIHQTENPSTIDQRFLFRLQLYKRYQLYWKRSLCFSTTALRPRPVLQTQPICGPVQHCAGSSGGAVTVSSESSGVTISLFSCAPLTQWRHNAIFTYESAAEQIAYAVCHLHKHSPE